MPSLECLPEQIFKHPAIQFWKDTFFSPSNMLQRAAGVVAAAARGELSWPGCAFLYRCFPHVTLSSLHTAARTKSMFAWINTYCFEWNIKDISHDAKIWMPWQFLHRTYVPGKKEAKENDHTTFLPSLIQFHYLAMRIHMARSYMYMANPNTENSVVISHTIWCHEIARSLGIWKLWNRNTWKCFSLCTFQSNIGTFWERYYTDSWKDRICSHCYTGTCRSILPRKRREMQLFPSWF